MNGVMEDLIEGDDPVSKSVVGIHTHEETSPSAIC